jgi:hypothetical protein
VVDGAGAVVLRFGSVHSERGISEALDRLAKLAPAAELAVAIERPSGLLVERLLEAGIRSYPCTRTRRVRKFGRADLQGSPCRRQTGQRPSGSQRRSLGRGRATGPRELNVATKAMAAMAALGVRSGSLPFARPTQTRCKQAV